MKKFISITFLLAAVLLIGCQRDTTNNKFAQCINDSEAVMYGAYWCENCENQLAMFGDSKDLVPYVECAEGGKDANPALCLEEAIEAYPTWKFTDGSVVQGVQSFENLSELTNCSLPGEQESVLFQ